MQEKLIEYLSSFVTEKRITLFKENISHRTKYLTIAMEDIYQPHNASAVLRTCDCFGIQDVHIIENKNKYKINPGVALGSSKWLDLNYYNKLENNSLDAINSLRSKGYRIVSTVLNKNANKLHEFDLSKGKTALFFGTELTGLSENIINNSDESLYIEMLGFTESFNISVSAAIIMSHLSMKLRNSKINWHFSNSEMNEVLIKWLKASIKKSDILIDEFYKRFE